MLVIGNKKYRNLQEQVGWNTEQIEKIFEFLDGINVSDNVVVVLDISTPLTAEELEIVNREVAFIVYNGELYFKRNQDSSYIYFDIIFQVTSGTIITFTSSEIAVTKSNGALGITTSTDYVYSKTQVDSLLTAKADLSYVNAQLALKADLSGANFTGNITAPSIIETMAGISAQVLGTVFTKDYIGCVKTGNKITFAVAGTVTTGDSIPDGGYTIVKFNVPSAITDALIPHYGAVLSYLNVPATTTEYGPFVHAEALFCKWGPGDLRFILRKTNLSVSTTYYFRSEITLLLSDSLV